MTVYRPGITEIPPFELNEPEFNIEPEIDSESESEAKLVERFLSETNTDVERKRRDIPFVSRPEKRKVGRPRKNPEQLISSQDESDSIPVKNSVHELLEVLIQRSVASSELQIQIAETLSYVKDEIVYIRDKQAVMSKRLKELSTIQSQLSAGSSIISLTESIDSLRVDVMDSNSKLSDMDAKINTSESVSKLTNAILSMKELIASLNDE